MLFFFRHVWNLLRIGSWVAPSVSFVILVLTLIWSNNPITTPLSDEINEKIISTLVSAQKVHNVHYADAPVPLMIDVSNDRTMVSLGSNRRPLVDRKKLLHLLQILKKYDNYRYILLDVYFSNATEESQWDTALYNTIANMRDIVLPANGDTNEAVRELKGKEAPAFYQKTIRSPQFIKYQLFYDGEKTLPLKMYEELNGGKINESPLCSWLSPVVLIDTSIFNFENLDQNPNKRQMGKEILWDSLWEGGYGKNLISDTNLTKDRIIIIGDFSYDGDDVHYTYTGEMPGAIINYNAYLTVLYGHHRIKLIPILLLFGLLWYNCCTYMAGRGFFLWLMKKSRNKVGRLILLLFDKVCGSVTIPLFFSILSFLIWQEVYDIFLITIFLSIFKSISKGIKQYKQ